MILRVRELLGLSLVAARERVDAGEVVLAEGDYMERYLHELQREFQKLGAVVSLR